jgi:N-acetylglucosaminyl-diphospho-decaprenol L-rhamnosyltransferase
LSRLAVVVVTHDSTGVLEATMDALVPQLREDDELVVVDCGSSVPPPVPPRARLIALRENRGFAGGAVVGAAETSAPLLFFLNPDARPAPGCLDAVREAPADWGAWQALVLLPGGQRVNTRGGVVHYLGFGWAGGHDEPVSTLAPSEVGFASGAALAVRRAAWDATGGFDPAFFMYGEDVDISLRMRLSGWRVGITPAARVEHDYEFDKGDYKWFHLERNRWWIVLGVYPAPLLALLAPALLGTELALLAVAGRDGWLGAKLRAQLAVLRTLPMALRRRRAIQARRSGGVDFADGLSASLDSPFLGAAGRVPAIRALQAGYWRAVRGALGG